MLGGSALAYNEHMHLSARSYCSAPAAFRRPFGLRAGAGSLAAGAGRCMVAARRAAADAQAVGQREEVRGPPLTDGERDGLRGIVSRRQWTWRIWLGGIPTAAVLALVAGERVFTAAAFAYLVLWCVVIFRAGFARCPRCHAFFDRGRLGSWNPWRRECGSCGLSRWLSRSARN
jgi:hypothetical protein